MEQQLHSLSLQQLNDTVLKTVEELKSALDVLISAEERLKEKNEELTLARELVEEDQRHSYQELFEFH